MDTMVLTGVTYIFLKNKFNELSVNLDLGQIGLFQKLPQLNAIDEYKCMKKDSCLEAEN